MEKQKITALTATDLSAAFDTVDHDILLEALQIKFGFTGQALHWFDSPLRPRGIQVITEDQRSDILNLPFSVPWGSCRGPMYYSVYASTLQECILDDLKFYLHASAEYHAYKNSLMPILGLKNTKLCVI